MYTERGKQARNYAQGHTIHKRDCTLRQERGKEGEERRTGKGERTLYNGDKNGAGWGEFYPNQVPDLRGLRVRKKHYPGQRCV